jgi:hypothetical protein
VRGAGSGILHASRLLLPAIIRVVDEEKREIEVCATSEALDSFGTVFGYDASKDAFTRWIGNVREMHERQAVGSSVALRFDDANRKIYVRVRISAGASDTWEKVKDGTLRGASIGAANVVWTRQRRDGKLVPVATSYDLNELSLVDNPANADALGFTFVRDGSIPNGVLEPLEWAADRERDATSDDGDMDTMDTMDTEGATASMTHDRAALSHDAHDHTHSGGYGDAHDHAGAHQHEDGSAHSHQHYHGHSHHDVHAQTDGYDVSSFADRSDDRERALGGADAHSHGHGHLHNHAHAYRVADGGVTDARSVTAEQARTRAYVSAEAWRYARGVEGRGLTADQYRIAAGVEQRLELEAAARAQGPFSRNPYAAADIGTPAQAEPHPGASHDELASGRIRQLDRDGQVSGNPATLASVSAAPEFGGTHTITELPDGFLELTDGTPENRVAASVAAPPAPAVVRGGIGANVEREIARIQAERSAERAAWAQRESGLAARIAALEAQPQAGGPVFNGMAAPVEKRDALTPGAGYGGHYGVSGAGGPSAGSSPLRASPAERIAALQAVAAGVTNPQLQVEIAAQIMLIQQEERGAPVEQVAVAMPSPQAARRAMPRQAW